MLMVARVALEQDLFELRVQTLDEFDGDTVAAHLDEIVVGGRYVMPIVHRMAIERHVPEERSLAAIRP